MATIKSPYTLPVKLIGRLNAYCESECLRRDQWLSRKIANVLASGSALIDVPKAPESKLLTLTMPEDVRNLVTHASKDLGVSASALMDELITQILDSQE